MFGTIREAVQLAHTHDEFARLPLARSGRFLHRKKGNKRAKRVNVVKNNAVALTFC